MNYINGEWIPINQERAYQPRDPADLSCITGSWAKSTVEETQGAIQAAQEAFPAWSALSAQQRAGYFGRVIKLMQERIDRIAVVITRENGKTLKESRAEVSAGIQEMEFQMAEGTRLAGEVLPSRQEGVMAYSVRHPLGAVSVIAPWNFPFNVPCRKITPALMAGNTCIFKPANPTPGVGAEFVKLFDDAGLPPGVLNFVTGSGAVVGEELVVNPAIKAISFTGSTEVGMGIHKKAADNLTRTQLEMGGQNPLVILADADMDAAAEAAALAAFTCAGQWCTSTCRVIVEEPAKQAFLDRLLPHLKRIIIGKGTQPETTMGPVCGENQLRDILEGIAQGNSQGAHLFFGGNQIIEGDFEKGCFIEPTVFTEVTPDMYLGQEEVFGPVLSVISAKDFNDAVAIANQVKYGLSSSIYTCDLEKAMTFVEKTDVGLTHVNMPTAYREPQLSFGGIKHSGTGLPESGHTGIEFFTEHKVVYVKYR